MLSQLTKAAPTMARVVPKRTFVRPTMPAKGGQHYVFEPNSGPVSSRRVIKPPFFSPEANRTAPFFFAPVLASFLFSSHCSPPSFPLLRRHATPVWQELPRGHDRLRLRGHRDHGQLHHLRRGPLPKLEARL